MRNKILVALTLAAGCVAVPALAQDDLAAQGEKVWKRCAACHMIGDGAENRVGPELNGLIGRTAGTVEDFKYSDAMKKAGEDGLVWDNDKLFAYLENPKAMVPGTKMAFAGLKKEEDRHAVVAYIDTHGGEQ
ncbi:c-type cytochrome [Amaricoccus solimangrovi]|uniref:Cytochrome c family protein n=1 Tax=Amaricoccus solimangrovi TaxID=2589815 RepID=A0A501WXM5_9RHOB|nr:cytochrome c family protein [Amaricoccus solimangrovi]TPE52995.1 cytochrome c family protein [Amaricoccus solimangrovi]